MKGKHYLSWLIWKWELYRKDFTFWESEKLKKFIIIFETVSTSRSPQNVPLLLPARSFHTWLITEKIPWKSSIFKSLKVYLSEALFEANTVMHYSPAERIIVIWTEYMGPVKIIDLENTRGRGNEAGQEHGQLWVELTKLIVRAWLPRPRVWCMTKQLIKSLQYFVTIRYIYRWNREFWSTFKLDILQKHHSWFINPFLYIFTSLWLLLGSVNRPSAKLIFGSHEASDFRTDPRLGDYPVLSAPVASKVSPVEDSVHVNPKYFFVVASQTCN